MTDQFANREIQTISGIVPTAAGDMMAMLTGFAKSNRGNTRIWYGQLQNEKWAVASRFQYEIITKKQEEAFAVFREMTI